MFGYWIVRAAHFSDPDVELDRLFTALGFALFCAGALWVLYLALEPYVRKFWPTTVISWSRLLGGRHRRSRKSVGTFSSASSSPFRSCCCSASITTSVRCSGTRRSRPSFRIWKCSPACGRCWGSPASVVFNAAFNSLWIIFALVAVNLLVRRVWITAMVMVGFLMLTGLGSNDWTPPIWLGVLTSLIDV